VAPPVLCARAHNQQHDSVDSNTTISECTNTRDIMVVVVVGVSLSDVGDNASFLFVVFFSTIAR
jgi:hypothetical protein